MADTQSTESENPLPSHQSEHEKSKRSPSAASNSSSTHPSIVRTRQRAVRNGSYAIARNLVLQASKLRSNHATDNSHSTKSLSRTSSVNSSLILPEDSSSNHCANVADDKHLNRSISSASSLRYGPREPTSEVAGNLYDAQIASLWLKLEEVSSLL